MDARGVVHGAVGQDNLMFMVEDARESDRDMLPRGPVGRVGFKFAKPFRLATCRGLEIGLLFEVTRVLPITHREAEQRGQGREHGFLQREFERTVSEHKRLLILLRMNILTPNQAQPHRTNDPRLGSPSCTRLGGG